MSLNIIPLIKIFFKSLIFNSLLFNFVHDLENEGDEPKALIIVLLDTILCRLDSHKGETYLYDLLY